MKKNSLFIFFILSILLSSCSTPGKKNLSASQPLRPPLTTPNNIDGTFDDESQSNSDVQPTSRFETMPSPRVDSIVVQGDEDSILPRFKLKKSVKINVESLPLPAFINELFGNVLGLNFDLDPKLQKKTDLVTLRISDAQPPEKLYRTALQVLDNYGVSVRVAGDLIRVVPAQSGSHGATPPLIISGRNLPSVPVTHRVVFQMIPVVQVDKDRIRRWLNHFFQGQDLQSVSVPDRNEILLQGPPSLISQAIKIIDMLDRPLMRSKHSLRITPLYISATELVQRLESALSAQGYTIASKPEANAPTLLLPIESGNFVLVFAADKSLLQRIQTWAQALDKPDNITEKQLFFYSVQNTTAKSMEDVLNDLLVTGLTNATESKAVSGKKNVTVQPIQSTSKKNIVIDETRNALLFYGTAAQWQRLLPIIKKLDVPPMLVLLEVTVAGITLTDEIDTGIEWLKRNAEIGDFSGELGTSSEDRGEGIAIQSKGLNYFPISNSGQVLAALNAFEGNEEVTILSKPHIMVRSGEEATINVGTEVPIVTTQSTSSDLQQEGSSAILQQVQYRRTGTLLNVKPTVYAGNQVDLEISQEISQAEENNTSNISSPIILNRKISTKLTLADGNSVLLGGLISTEESEGNSGVPLLKDIPILGRLFRVDSHNKTRSEVIMLIIPYIVRDNIQAEQLTRAIQERLELMTTLPTVKQTEKP